MRHLRPLLLALTALSLTVGCAAPTTPTDTKAKTAAKPSVAAKTVNVTGTVVAPAGVIATGGGNVISTGGGNVIATGGLNYRQVLAVEEKPLVNTNVYLADADGKKVAGVAEVKTDAQGRYSFSKVPAKGNYVVTADAKTAEGKPAVLQSIVKVGTASVAAHLGASSTMVTALMLEEAAGNMAAFDSEAFDQAVAAVAEKMTAELMPDLSDRDAMLETMKGMKETLAAVSGMLDKLREELPDAAKDALDQAQKAVDEASALSAME
jgi:hypothetical protein